MMKKPSPRGVRILCIASFATVAAACSAITPRDLIGDTDFNTTSAVIDSIEQSLSITAHGDDTHSYFRTVHGIPYGATPNFTQTNRFGKMEPCTGADAIAQWGAQNCAGLSAMDHRIYCKENKRCISIIFADFIQKNSEYMTAIRKGLQDPCPNIPDYAKLVRRHGALDLKSPGSMTDARASKYWLFCDTKHPVTARLTPNNDAANSFNVTWHRQP
jgi:hypothetical protein